MKRNLCSIQPVGKFGWLTLVSALLAVILVFGFAVPQAFASNLPAKQSTQTGVTVQSNEKATVDASNLSEGYVMVRYTGGRSVNIKVQITKQNSSVTYTYNLNNAGNNESFPLSEGDGTYTVAIFENVTGSTYSQAYSCTVDMKLRNSFLPFLYPNQYVNFSSTGAVASTAKTLADSGSTLGTVQNVFTYVVDNLTYDTALATSVSSGYLPDVEKVLANKKGICFDYAALMTAMLRSQNIPCKLVVGYAGQVYHAWINVYIPEVGWIDKAIYFDGSNWSLMDPTFSSTANSTADVVQYTGDGTYYSQKYAY